ncbi:MAG: MaoC family dehydratase [Myxococcales bacterium]
MQKFTRDDNYYEDLEVGTTIVHPRGRTVSDEHMLWTNFVLNTAQLHFNQKMCDDSPQTTFNGRRVVYGGIVFAFVAGLASEETEENALAQLSYDEGRHLNPVFAGDTLFAESTIVSKTDDVPYKNAGVVKILLRGKNQRGEVVLEITRELVVAKRP